MTLTTEEKQKITKSFQTNSKDTASANVQIALLTEKLNKLNNHFKNNPKDNHSRRGLLHAVSQRRKFLDYLHRKNSESYKEIIKKLGIRK